MGFDWKLSSSEKSAAEAAFPGETFDTAIDMQNTRPHRAWWKQNGDGNTNAIFDLSEGSKSMQQFAKSNAMFEKRKRRQAERAARLNLAFDIWALHVSHDQSSHGNRSGRSRSQSSAKIKKTNKRREMLGLPPLKGSVHAKDVVGTKKSGGKVNAADVVKDSHKRSKARGLVDAVDVVKGGKQHPEFKAKADRRNASVKKLFAEEQRVKKANVKRKKAGLPLLKTSIQKADEARGSAAEGRRQAMLDKAAKSFAAAKARTDARTPAGLRKVRQAASKSLGRQRKKALTGIAQRKAEVRARVAEKAAQVRKGEQSQAGARRKGERIAGRLTQGLRQASRSGRGRQNLTDEQIIEQERERKRRAKLRASVV